jgi:hypothetical protein
LPIIALPARRPVLAKAGQVGAQMPRIREAEEFGGSLSRDSYLLSQELARQLLDEASLGVIYPSVRHQNGTCVACFRPALVMNVRKGATYRFTWKGKAEPEVSAL